MSPRRRLTLEEREARERMRLVTPATAYKVVGHPRYWTRQFVALYLQSCDALSRTAPEDAAQLAEQAPILVQRVRLDDSAASYPSETAKRSMLAMAHVMRDQYFSRVGRTEYRDLDAQRLEQLVRQGVEGYAVAERLKRRALPVFCEGDRPGALRMLNRAIDIAELKYPRITREALALRGMLRHQTFDASALEDFGMAVALVERFDPPDYRFALETLLAIDYDLMRFIPTMDGLRCALTMVRLLRARLAHRPRCRLKMWVYWISGQMTGRLGSERHAYRRLAKATALSSDVGRPLEQAFLRLDLAAAARANDRAAQAEDLAREVVERLRAHEATAAVLDRLGFEPPLDGAQLDTVRGHCWPLLAEDVYGGVEEAHGGV